MIRAVLFALAVTSVLAFVGFFTREVIDAVNDDNRRLDEYFARRRRAWQLLRIATLEHELLEGPFDHSTVVCVRCARAKYGEGVQWVFSDRDRVEKIILHLERGLVA
jgi:hypothetical protein